MNRTQERQAWEKGRGIKVANSATAEKVECYVCGEKCDEDTAYKARAGYLCEKCHDERMQNANGKCPECDTPYEQGMGRCGKCGHKFENADMPPTEQELRTKHAKEHHGKFTECKDCEKLLGIDNSDEKCKGCGATNVEIQHGYCESCSTRSITIDAKPDYPKQHKNADGSPATGKFIPQEVNGGYCEHCGAKPYLWRTGTVWEAGVKCMDCGNPATGWYILKHEYLRNDDGENALTPRSRLLKNQTDGRKRYGVSKA